MEQRKSKDPAVGKRLDELVEVRCKLCGGVVHVMSLAGACGDYAEVVCQKCKWARSYGQ